MKIHLVIFLLSHTLLVGTEQTNMFVCEKVVDISKYKGRAPKTVKEDVAQWLLNYDHITRRVIVT